MTDTDVRETFPDATPETVREHLRDVHGDYAWDTDEDPMGLHRMIHEDAVPPDSKDPKDAMGWRQGHLHPSYPLFEGEEPTPVAAEAPSKALDTTTTASTETFYSLRYLDGLRLRRLSTYAEAQRLAEAETEPVVIVKRVITITESEKVVGRPRPYRPRRSPSEED